MERKATPDVLADVLGPAPSAPKWLWLALDKIRSDGGTQMRAALDDGTVAEYVELMGTGLNEVGPFPPIIVFYDGKDHWLADGFHRVAAARIKADRLKIIMSLPADVRAGTRRDAILYAAGANAAHGLRRTNADKERAVDVLLRDEQWRQWSDGIIADRCAVSDRYVSKRRKVIERELTPNRSESAANLTPNGSESAVLADPAPVLRHTADGRTINTANIGRNRPEPFPGRFAEIWQLQQVVHGVTAKLLGDDIPADIVAADLRKSAGRHMGGTWDLIKGELATADLRWRAADLAQAMNNEASLLDTPAIPRLEKPVHIDTVAWREMSGTALQQSSAILAELEGYAADQQQAIVRMLTQGKAGTVASAAAVLWPAGPPAPAPAPPADATKNSRITDFVRLRQTYLATLDSLERFGELTGRATLTLPAKRAVTDLLEVVNAELRDLGAA